MKRTLNMIVSEILAKKKEAKLTGHEIAEVIVKTEREFITKKIKRTGKTEKALVFQLMSEIGAQYPKMKFLGVGKTTSHPIKYYYKASLIRKVAPAAKATKAAKPAKSAKAVKGTKKTSKKAK